MTLKAMDPFGLALEEYCKGNKEAKIYFHRDDGKVDEYFLRGCFRTVKEFSELEKKAVGACFGKILDIGAGVGPHSLELQNMGHNVLAIDVSPPACSIMRTRGIKNVKCSTIYDLKDKGFDTLLLMGRAIGFVGDLKGLDKFLNHCKTKMNLDGMILLDSIDLRLTSNPEHLAYHERNRKLGRYIGVIGLKMEFKGKYGKSFKLLHIDPDMLKKHAFENGFNCVILHQEGNGSYLAKLSLK